MIKMVITSEVITKKLNLYKNQLRKLESELEDYRLIVQHKQRTLQFIQKKIEELEK